ncbi:MAG: hypothetical protein AB1546_00730 [bacterium]
MRHHDVAFIYGDMSPYNKAVPPHSKSNFTPIEDSLQKSPVFKSHIRSCDSRLILSADFMDIH